MSTVRPAGSYGIDAPWVPWLLTGLGVAYLAFAAIASAAWQMPVWAAASLSALAVFFLVSAIVFWHTSLLGKFAVWAELLDQTEPPTRALDLGCGRGAVTVLAALRFPQARIDGIDLWRGVDQSGNSLDAARTNARANRVEDRITFTTGDMTAMPYPDASFDLVTASVSIHNIPHATGRAKAIHEAWRTLAPGGKILIVDISRTAEYRSTLAECGAVGLEVRPAGWRTWWGGPWVSSSILSATKPAVVS